VLSHRLLFSELGLCTDHKKLMKKRIRRGLKEGDAGYLGRASDTDSALEDSSSGSDDGSESGSSESSESDDDEAGAGSSDELAVVKHLKELLSNDGKLVVRHERYCDSKEKERDGTGWNGTVTGLNGTM
jgi:hypothetical protein